jgi:hypothetical protein
MKSSARLTVFLALLATLLFTAVAGANTLKVSRAAKANRTFTRLVCKESNDDETRCVASKSSGCRRISKIRVRCSMYLTLESVKDGSQVRCQGLVEWVLGKRGISPHFLGFRSCTEVRGPEPESEPTPPPSP